MAYGTLPSSGPHQTPTLASWGSSTTGLSVLLGVALVVGAVSQYAGMFFTAVWVVITMPCHEVGHAALHWLSGTPAIPSVFITLATSPSSTFAALLTLAFPTVAYIEYRRGRYLIAGTAVGILFVQLYLSYVAPAQITEQVVLLAGIGGEILWAPLFALFAFTEQGDTTKRYVVGFAAAAAVSLGNSITTWIKIYLGRAPLPTGALLMDPSEGDLDRLMADFMWTPQSLTYFYCGLCAVSLWLLLLILVIAHDKNTKIHRVGELPDGSESASSHEHREDRFRRSIS